MSQPGNRIALLTFLFAVGALACTGGDGTNRGTEPTDAGGDGAGAESDAGMREPKVIIVVVDALRPEMLNATTTPRLQELAAGGTIFPNSRTVFPSVTMCAAGALATGSFPGRNSWPGAAVYAPHDAPQPGISATGSEIDLEALVTARDWASLTTLDNHYQQRLLTADTLFAAAQEQGLTTAALGKSGPTFIQDIRGGGILVDSSHVYPLELALELQAAGHPLPANTALRYPEGAITVDTENLPPQAEPMEGMAFMEGLTAFDPTSSEAGSSEIAFHQYITDLFLDYILPEKDPDLSLIWYQDPDNTEHKYGPTGAGLGGLQTIDTLVGKIADRVQELGLAESTNFVVLTDHGHSWVSGDLEIFPPRSIEHADRYGCDDKESGWDSCSDDADCGLCADDETVRCRDEDDCSEVGGLCDYTGGVKCVVKRVAGLLGGVDRENGWSFSGWLSVVDLLDKGGFEHVYDGSAAVAEPGQGGIFEDGSLLYPLQSTDASTDHDDQDTASYSVKGFPLPPPDELPDDALIVVGNGGNVLIFSPASGDRERIADVVAYLQRLEQIGAIFVNDDHAAVPGTLPLGDVGLDFADPGRAPDIVFSLSYDAEAVIQGVPGTSYTTHSLFRGTHGSMSPIDMHTFILGWGPGFRPGQVVDTVAGIVDIAPTVAHLLGFELKGSPDGRVLMEGLTSATGDGEPVVSRTRVITPSHAAEGVRVCAAASRDCSIVDESKSSYTVELDMTEVTVGDRTYRYLDSARAVRQ